MKKARSKNYLQILKRRWIRLSLAIAFGANVKERSAHRGFLRRILEGEA